MMGSIETLKKEKEETIRERCIEKKVKKLTSVSFMYVCVAENAELLVFAVSGPTEHCPIFHFPPPSVLRSSVTGVTY